MTQETSTIFPFFFTQERETRARERVVPGNREAEQDRRRRRGPYEERKEKKKRWKRRVIIRLRADRVFNNNSLFVFISPLSTFSVLLLNADRHAWNVTTNR
jgi:hypothetical protein